ncbi:hypothetical protein K456DRAFT_1769604 [Colletotrichum gloeosporioides 23]|nr:hypothetical protein K456DRAFT_1769604 [Colletotrichum gloeosporioides 23]
MRKGQHSREAKKAVQAVGIVLARAGGPRFDMQLMSRSMEEMPMETTSSHQKADEEEAARVWKDDKWLEEALCLGPDISTARAPYDQILPGQYDTSLQLDLRGCQEGVNTADWILLNDRNP